MAYSGSEIAQIILSISTLLAALGGFWTTVRSKKVSETNTGKIDLLQKTVNGGLTVRIAEAKELGNKQGQLEQIDIQKEEKKNE